MGGACVAQSVKCLTSAQVMISKFMGLRPASGSVLTAWSLEPVSDSVCPSLCPSPAFKTGFKKILEVCHGQAEHSVSPASL